LQQEIINFFKNIERVYKANLPFVVYRKPNENKVTLLVQKSTGLFELKSFNEKGFVFAPFNKSEAKFIFPIEECEQFSIDIHKLEDLNVNENKAEVVEVSDQNIEKSKHIELVKKSVECIQKNEADKIVVSRKKVLKVADFDILNSYKKMLKNYQNAMVYLWFHPKVGTWMGASPERLINCKDNIFKTMSLAGTQPYRGEVDVEWSDKEKKEQQFVTYYILNIIKQSIQNIQVSKPYTVKAGNLLHLRTDIYGDLDSKELLGDLIDSLHPTPAVCGLPKQIATNFILENEQYNRSFYSGYLGELNLKNETNLFVNLRCMNLNDNEISIYIGGGITSKSNPEKEWEETVFKTQVMKNIL